jgi:Uma2 family endonuclease
MDLPPRMTEAEYLRWADEDTFAEWVDGRVVPKGMVSGDEDELRAYIAAVIERFAKVRRLGKVRGPQFQMRLLMDSKVVRREPDVLFISAANAERAKPTVVQGSADLVVEIVSAESEFRDFNEKFREYERAGVREYWIVNPLSRQVHLFVRDEKTSHFQKREASADGRFHSSVIAGLWFHPDDLFDPTRRDAFALLKQIDPALLA